MRILPLLFLVFILTACGSNSPDPLDMQTQSATPTKPLPSITAPAPESSVLLHVGNEIHVLDLVTGKDVPGYTPINTGIPTFSADAKKFAAIETRGQSCEPMAGGRACYPGAGILKLVETQTLHTVTSTLASAAWVGNIALSPDATRVALAYNQGSSSTIMLADAHSAQIVAQRVIEFRPSFTNFVQDGKTVVVYGQPVGDDPGNIKPPPPRAMSLDAATLQVEWEQTLANITSGSWCLENCGASHEERLSVAWYPAVIPSKDGNKLYIVHADADKLTTIDFSTHTIGTTEIQTARSWFENFLALFTEAAEAKGGFSGAYEYGVLSSDGNRIYVSGSTMNMMRDSGNRPDSTYAVADLQMIDVASGKRMASRALVNRNDTNEYFQGINITPDGERVFIVRNDPHNNWWTEVFKAQNLQPIERLDNWRVFVARRMDGQPILLAHLPNFSPLQLALIDPHTFQVIRSWSVDAGAGWVHP